MRILMVTPMPPQPQAPGAIPLVLHAEITGLLARHEVELITVAGMEPGEHAAVERLEGGTGCVRAVKRVNPQGWDRWKRRYRMASAWASGRYPWRSVWFWEPELQTLLDKTLSEQHFDLVIVEDNSMGMYTYRTDAPTLFTEHEVRMPRPIEWAGFKQNENKLYWGLGELDWARWQRYQLSVWKRFDRIQAFTQHDADRICTLAPELKTRVRVNPFGVDLPLQADPAQQVEGNILFVGNFTHIPNVDAALWLGKEIMPALRQLYPAVKLSLIGIHPPDAVRSLERQDIHVTGHVDDLTPYMQKAAVVVAPIRIGGGMRMKVLHSMGMGKAIVTTSRGADGLQIGAEMPPVILAEDAPVFARAVAGLLSDRSRRIDLGSRAREYVAQHFSPEAYTRRIEAIYDEMVEERKRSAHDSRH